MCYCLWLYGIQYAHYLTGCVYLTCELEEQYLRRLNKTQAVQLLWMLQWSMFVSFNVFIWTYHNAIKCIFQWFSWFQFHSWRIWIFWFCLLQSLHRLVSGWHLLIRDHKLRWSCIGFLVWAFRTSRTSSDFVEPS